MNTNSNTSRIAKNTMILYFRMILTMVVSLYTSRVVLSALGFEDFGIYSVIGGVVAMFSIISGSLSAAVSRFITFELGKGNTNRLKIIFSSSVTIHLLLALIIFIIAEVGGIWFLNYKMNIPDNRLFAANWVYQFSIITFLINLISIPYNATIIAHERMNMFAYVSIIEVVLKLLIVYLIMVIPNDKLIFYSFLLVLISLIVRVEIGRALCRERVYVLV